MSENWDEPAVKPNRANWPKWALPLIAVAVAGFAILFIAKLKSGDPEQDAAAETVVDAGAKKDTEKKGKQRPTQSSVSPKPPPATLAHEAKKFYDRRSSELPKDIEYQRLFAILDTVVQAIADGQWTTFRQYVDVRQHAAIMIKHQPELRSDVSKLQRMLNDDWEFSIPIQDLKVAHIEIKGKPAQATAYTWTLDRRGVHWRVIWHFKSDSRRDWVLTDWEFLDWAQRESEINAEYFSANTTASGAIYRDWHNDMTEFTASLASDNRNLNVALTALRRASSREVQDAVKGEVMLKTGNAWEELGFFGKALERYRQTTAPGSHREQASLSFRSRRYRDCIKSAKEYLKQLGSGSWVHGILAASYLAVGDYANAQEHYSAALDCHPNDPRSLLGLAKAISVNRLDQLQDRISDTDDKLEATLVVAESALSHGNVDLLQHLAPSLAKYQQMESVSTDDQSRILTLLVRQQEWAGQSQTVLKMLWNRLEAAKTPQDKLLATDVLHAAIHRNGTIIDVLTKSPDQRAALTYLLNEMELPGTFSSSDSKKVASFLATYSKSNPQDPLGPFLQAMLLLTRDEGFAQQVAYFRQAESLCKLKSDDWLKAHIQRGLVAALIKTNMADDAYQVAKPANGEELAQFANKILFEKQSTAVLQALARFEKDNKNDPVVQLFRAIVDQQQGNHGKAILKLADIKPAALPVSQRIRLWLALQTSHVHFGTELSLYQQSKDKLDTFLRLSEALIAAGKLAAHEKLCKRFEKDATKSEHGFLLQARCNALWTAKNFAAFSELQSKRSQFDMIALSTTQQSTTTERVVRALLRQRKPVAALAAATEARATLGLVKPQLIALLANHRATKAMEAMQKCSFPRQTVSELLHDVDVGGLLRGKYKEVLRVYPPRLLLAPHSHELLFLLAEPPTKWAAAELAKSLNLGDQVKVTTSVSEWTKKNAVQVFVVADEHRSYTVTVGSRPLPRLPLQGTTDKELGDRFQSHRGWISLRAFRVKFSDRRDYDFLLKIAAKLPTEKAITVGTGFQASQMTSEVRKQLNSGAGLAGLKTHLRTFRLGSLTSPGLTTSKPLDRYQLEKAWRSLKKGQAMTVSVPISLAPQNATLTMRVMGIERARSSAREVVARLDSAPSIRPDLVEGMTYSVPIETVKKFRIVDGK